MATTPHSHDNNESAPGPVGHLTEVALVRSGGLDPDLLGDYVAALTRVSDKAGRLSQDELEGYRRLGAEAAETGVPLTSLIDLYLSITWRLWRHLPAVAAAVPDLARVQSVGQSVIRASGDAVTAVSDGYQSARQAVIRRQEAARREFIDDLLSGNSDVTGLLARAPGFGLDLTGPHTVAVARAPWLFTEGSQPLGRVESALSRRGSPPTLVASKDGLLVVIATVNDTDGVSQVTAAITAGLGPRDHTTGHWQIGVGRVRPGPGGVLTAYDEARNALDLADRLSLDTPVVHAADLLVYPVLLRDRAAIADLITTTLEPLTRTRSSTSHLLDTLDTYLAAGANTAETARRLHLSVRAVTYRLARIRQLTGLDPADTDLRFTLHAAVLGARLLDWPTTPLPAAPDGHQTQHSTPPPQR